MVESEVREFVQEILVGLWPHWKPTNAEIGLWVRELEPYSWSDAKDKAELYHTQGGSKHRRPNLSELLTITGSRHKEQFNVNTCIYVECCEHPDVRRAGLRYGVFTPSNYTHEQQMTAAENLREQIIAREGGEWLTRRVAPVGDDGLSGDAAKQRAEELILAGPDTPGKRFLQSLTGELTLDAMRAVLKTVDDEIRPKNENQKRTTELDEIPF